MIKLKHPSCPNPEALKKGQYSHKKNKEALKRGTYDKCMYCESKISHISFGDIEHIKPKSIFPNEKYKWENLGYSCSQCNNIKSNKYNEKNPIINPYTDTPSKHLLALGAILEPKSKKGKITIEKSTGLNLNRNALLEARGEKVKILEKFIETAKDIKNPKVKENLIEALKDSTKNNSEYSFVAKSLWIANQNSIKK